MYLFTADKRKVKEKTNTGKDTTKRRTSTGLRGRGEEQVVYRENKSGTKAEGIGKGRKKKGWKRRKSSRPTGMRDVRDPSVMTSSDVPLTF